MLLLISGMAIEDTVAAKMVFDSWSAGNWNEEPRPSQATEQ